LLLKDPRVDVAFTDLDGCTPLWYAARYGHLEVAERLMASGRDFGDLNKKGLWGSEYYSSLGIARKEGN